MQTVYDAQGNSFTVDAVDAREYLATGRFFTEKPEQDTEKPKRRSKTAKQEAEKSKQEAELTE